MRKHKKKLISLGAVLLLVAGAVSAKEWVECYGSVCCYSSNGKPPYICS